MINNSPPQEERTNLTKKISRLRAQNDWDRSLTSFHGSISARSIWDRYMESRWLLLKF